MHFTNITPVPVTALESIIENPERKLSELPLLKEAERHQLLVDWGSAAGAEISRASKQREEKTTESRPRADDSDYEETIL